MRLFLKAIGIILAFSILLSSVIGCSYKSSKQTSAGVIRAGVVLSTGGRGDKAFNDAAIAGLEKAKKELGIEYKDIQPRDVADDEKALQFLAREGYDIVFGIGFMMKDAVLKVALKYPNTKFAIIDSDYGDKTPPNLLGLVFKEQEGSFLAGAIAALISKTNAVGFIGGMDTPLIHHFEDGYKAGAKYINPQIEVLIGYVGTDSFAFNNPDKAKEITLNMISSKKADVVFHASGGSGQGVIEAASSGGIKAIGCDSNQNWVKPGTVITSMLKRTDVVVNEVVKLVMEGKFKGGTAKYFGLAENGVDLSDLNNLTPEETVGISKKTQKRIKETKDSIPKEIKQRVKEIREKIILGEIKVTK